MALISMDRFGLKIFIFCVLTEVTLVLADLFLYFGDLPFKQIRNYFDMTREMNLPTWFSSVQLLTTGVFAGLIALRIKVSKAPKWKIIGWAVLSLFFTYMAVDDATYFHERIGDVFDSICDGQVPAGSSLLGCMCDYPNYYWQILFGPFFLGMALFILIFLWKELPSPELKFYLILGITCYTIAVGLDFIDGNKSWYPWMIKNTSLNFKEAQHCTRVLEEFIELYGTNAVPSGIYQ